jgi:tocopherol O-methyltransferase
MIFPSESVSPDAVADHYDDLDRIYREIWGDHVHHGLWETGRESASTAVNRLVDRVADEAGISNGDRVCDVGCGYGATARRLAGTRGATVSGITLSPAQWRYAGERAHEVAGVEIHRGDWLSNGFPDGSFDRVIAIESTEHMADKSRCFAEIRRVLRPGGRAVVCAWLAAERPSAWAVRHLLEPICREGRLPGMGSETDYRRFIGEAGLELEGCRDLSRQVARTWSLCILRFLAALPRSAALRRYLLAPRASARNRDFAPTLLRIRWAYATGAMRYGLFVARSPSVGAPSTDSRSAAAAPTRSPRA